MKNLMVALFLVLHQLLGLFLGDHHAIGDDLCLRLRHLRSRQNRRVRLLAHSHALRSRRIAVPETAVNRHRSREQRAKNNQECKYRLHSPISFSHFSTLRKVRSRSLSSESRCRTVSPL